MLRRDCITGKPQTFCYDGWRSVCQGLVDCALVAMLILAADTSTAANSVALSHDGRLLAEITVHTDYTSGRRHSERLLSLVDWVLKETDTPLEAVDLLAIGTGPGSFTGLRIGVAAWKGLALAGGKKLVGVPTLSAMSRLASVHEGLVCPVLDARMNEVYAAAYAYDGGARIEALAPYVGPVQEFVAMLAAPGLFVGDGVERFGEDIRTHMPEARFGPAAMNLPRAWAVAAEALALYEAGAHTDGKLVTPVYLREANALTLREREARAAQKAAASATRAGIS